MSFSREPVHDDRHLIRYLLGLLPDDEAERLDEQTLVDDEAAARLRSVENDLVDAYVSGTLDAEARERFESFYLASPRRREKVKFAARFLAAVDRPPVAASQASVSAPGVEEIRNPGGVREDRERVAPRWRVAWLMRLAAALVRLKADTTSFWKTP
jgi:anti-sigma factor RsiW